MKDSIDTEDYEKAMKIITENRIARFEGPLLRDHFVVTGSNDDYLVIRPNFCTCEHFIMRCLKEPGKVCYHIRAVSLAGKITKITHENWIDLLTRDH